MSLKRKIGEISMDLNQRVCALCCSDEDDPVFLGKFLRGDTISAHKNCLFFASGLIQNCCEDDTRGLCGFLLTDIENEIRRGKKLFCAYCKKRGATVGCCVTICKKTFHLNCGIRNGSLQQYYDSFPSFCKQHKPKQKPQVPDEYVCGICAEDITPEEIEDCLYSPCCRRKISHKICLQRYAISAGFHHSKCPYCNNTNRFIEEMLKHGIDFPVKDASWELEDGAFSELEARPECDAPKCKCPNGRRYCSQRKSGWTLVICTHCGFHARHKKCGNIDNENKWLCAECYELDNEIIKNKALSKTGDKPHPCVSNLSLLPKVILEDCLTTKSSLHPDTPYLNISDDTLSNSVHLSNKQESYEKFESATKPPENSETSKVMELDNERNSNSVHLPEIIRNNDMDICETPVVPGPSSCNFTDAAKKTSVMSVNSRAANLRDIKNVPYNSQVQRVKNSSKTRASGKFTKKQKVDNQSIKGNQSLITSYFCHSTEKNIRL